MRRINYHEACALWMWFFSVLYYKNSTVGEAPAAFQLRREGTVWPRPRKPPEPWPMPIGPNRTWAGRIRNPGRRMHRSLGRRHTQPQASEHSEGFFFWGQYQGLNPVLWARPQPATPLSYFSVCAVLYICIIITGIPLTFRSYKVIGINFMRVTEL